MGRAAKKLLEEALELSDSERTLLAEELLASVAPSPQVDAAWRAELQRRVDEIEAGRSESSPWTEVRERLLGATR